ncbi:MAG: AAA-associated domain-containing protein [Firmicutes bacterium]|nr:AAA-associated domain-containing protein [Bacillota bacterium]
MDDGPLPRVGIGMVLGLLEMLDDARGRADIFRLARDLSMELDDIGPVIEAAKILGFIDTVRGDITLTPLAARLLEADINIRKSILAERLKGIGVFRDVLRMIRVHRNRRIRRQQVVDFLAKNMSDEEANALFQTLVDWGRFAEIIDYDVNGEILSMA